MESFQELSLLPEISRAIADLGFEKPSKIQELALPILLGEPTDFIGLAATGTGKTAAFAIPMLQRLDPESRAVQALILCPTRELAIQVSGQVELLGKHLGIRSLPIYGGAGYGDQIRGLNRGVQVVVGTPGRMVDHLEKGTLDLSGVSTVILDEADEMISMGFKEDLQTILSAVAGEIEEPIQRLETSNIWLFSATMSREVRNVADEYLFNPRQVEVNRTEMLPSTLEQLYYMTSESNKPEVLCKLIDAADEFYGLVFCQTKSLVVDLTGYLRGRGYRVDCLHGDMDQNARERTMKAFRERRVMLLVCTDVAARGLDVKDVSHVINYSLPRELDSYVHRIGRTARSGKVGYAMSLVTPSHKGLVGRIERATKSKMKEGKIPTRKDVGLKKVSQIGEKLMEQSQFARAVELMGPDFKRVFTEMEKDELVGRFLTLMLPEVFAERAPEAKPMSLPQGLVLRSAEVNAPQTERAQENARQYERRHERRGDRREDRRDGDQRPSKSPWGAREDRGFKKPFAKKGTGYGAKNWGERPERRDDRPSFGKIDFDAAVPERPRTSKKDYAAKSFGDRKYGEKPHRHKKVARSWGE